MEYQKLRGKFRGALLGAAVGDALGAPFEGLPHVEPSALEDLVRQPRALRYTDDTHMTLGVARSLVACRGFDGVHMAHTLARNFAREPWRGYGAGPPEVFRMLERGVPWDRAAAMLFGGEGSYGNGAAMRMAPIALVAAPFLAEVVWLARASARITHAHEIGIEGAVLQACAIGLALQRPEELGFDIPSYLDALRAHLRARSFMARLELIGTLLQTTTDGGRRLGHGVAADESVPAALYAFLRCPRSFVDVVTYAIGLGGDTDTIASMAGALAGAYLGEQAIPPAWREGVEGADELIGLADELLSMTGGRVQVRSRCVEGGA